MYIQDLIVCVQCFGVLINMIVFFYITVQSKALAGAKSFGSFLYSAVNKAGKTVSEASAKIKETVEKNVSSQIGIYIFLLFTMIMYFICI